MFMFGVYFLVAALVLFAFWLISKDITWKEALLQLGAQTFFIIIMCLLIKNAHMGDSETLSGLVTSKERDEVHCRHSYSCPPCWTTCTGGKVKTCTTHCSTCYEHDYDVEWLLHDSNKHTFDIDTIDRQGIKEPPRYTRAQIGDPTAYTHSYQNYIKADPDSLFASSVKPEEIKNFPSYPQKVYDYHYMDRFIDLTKKHDTKAFNRRLSELNGYLGRKHQVNMVVIVTDKNIDWAKKLQRVWEGGKKNDVIVVAMPENNYQVLGISYPDFKVKLRNALMDNGEFNANSLEVIGDVVQKHFKRRPMSEFAYLKETYKPTQGEWIFGLIVSILLSVGLGFLMHYQDIFNEQNSFSSNRRRY